MKTFLFLSIFCFYPLAADATNFSGLTDYIREAKYIRCDDFKQKKQPKIAIFEKSFGDVEALKGLDYPEDVVLLNPKEHQNNSKSIHGRYVVSVYSKFLSKFGNCNQNLAKIYLIPSEGYSQFKAGIDKAIQLGVDIILHNQVFEYLGNGDGQGFINKEVNRAIDNGIIWINASGNYQGLVYQEKIQRASYKDNHLKFNNTKSSDRIYFSCTTKSILEKCNLSLTLTWNSFQDSIDLGTDKNLDLAVYNQRDEIVKYIDSSSRLQRAISSRIQTSEQKVYQENPKQTTLYPYERIQVELSHGTYYVKIIDSYQGQWQNKDQFRLSFNLDNGRIKLIDQSKEANTVFPPADNPKVITVGAFDADQSSDYYKIKKPDVYDVSVLKIKSNEFIGSSIAATIFAAKLTLIKGMYPDYDKDQVLEEVFYHFAD